jgi:lysophospholipase L1-like esterase
MNPGGTGGTGSDPKGGEGGESGDGSGGLTAFRMVVIGSSTAAGEGASSSSRGWVSLLSTALDDVVTTEWSARNLAQGGYTTSELLPDSGANGNIDDALELEPNLVIVALAGSNDLSAGTSESTFLSRLTTLRDTARAAGVPVFFMSTAPKDLSASEREALRDWADAMEATFDSCWVPERTDEYSPCFIDVFTPLANSSLGINSAYGDGDGIHLNDAGHEVIFEAAREIVSAYVCSTTACR